MVQFTVGMVAVNFNIGWSEKYPSIYLRKVKIFQNPFLKILLSLLPIYKLKTSK